MTRVRLKSGGQATAMSAAKAAQLPQPARFGTGVFLSDSRIALLQNFVSTQHEPNWTGWNEELAALTVQPPLGPLNPYYCPNSYNNPDGFAAAEPLLRLDCRRAYAMALKYRITGDSTFAAGAVAIIQAWNTVDSWTLLKGADTALTWSYHFPGMIMAADLLKNTPEFTSSIKAAFATLVTASRKRCSTAFAAVNNHADWGVVFEIAAGAYLADHSVFDAAVARWKYLIDTQVSTDNVLLDEVYRSGGGQGDGSSGLNYSLFALMAKTIAAEIARVNGINLFTYIGAKGQTLRGIYETIGPWAADPVTFPYNTSGTVTAVNTTRRVAFEILDQDWPTVSGAAILATNRPIPSRQAGYYPTFTHGGLTLSG